jgi:hypothetical protein
MVNFIVRGQRNKKNERKNPGTAPTMGTLGKKAGQMKSISYIPQSKIPFITNEHHYIPQYYPRQCRFSYYLPSIRPPPPQLSLQLPLPGNSTVYLTITELRNKEKIR